MGKLDLGQLILIDEIEYAVISKLEHNSKQYVLFTNTDDPEDVFVREEVIVNDEMELHGLKDADEFEDILNKFYEILKN